MVFGDALTKAGRLVELQRLFWRNPRRTMTSAEIARRLAIPERSVRKYVAEMSASGRLPVTRDRRGWVLADDTHLDVLSFPPEIATGVHENRRRPSQRLEELPDGTLELTLTVASTVELLPWILGWGRHCQVIEPDTLRAEVAAEHRAALAATNEPTTGPRGP